MAQVDEILIELKIDAGDTAQKLVDVQKRIDDVRSSSAELKREQKDLKKEISDTGQATSQQSQRMAEISSQLVENAANMKQLTAEEKMYTAQLNLATQNDRKFGDSLIEMSAQLAQLKQEYRGLSAAQREGAEGKQLQQSIAGLDKALKDADATLGDHQRNVGNYQSALLGLNGNVGKVAQMFGGGFKAGVQTATTSVKTFSKTLLATPIGWIAAAVGAVVAIFKKLRDGFKNNDEASTKLSASLAKFRPILDGVAKVFSTMAGVVAKVAGAVADFAAKLIGKVSPAFKEASDRAAEYVYKLDELEERERDYTIASAERAREIAELKKEEAENEKLTAKEREDIFKQIDDLELEDLKQRQEISRKKYEAAKYEMERTKSTNDELANNLAATYAQMLRDEADYLNATTRNSRKASEARKEQARELDEQRRQSAQAWRERQQRIKEQRETEAKELRELEKLQIDAIADLEEQARVSVTKEYDWQIADLQKRLNEERNLTATAREAIKGQIVELEKAKYRELAALDEQFAEAQRKREEEEAAAKEAAAKEAADAASKAEADRLASVRDTFDAELQNTANRYAEKMNEFYGNAVEQSRIQLEQAVQYADTLKGMDAQTIADLYGNEENYKAAVLAAEAEIQRAKEANEQALQAQAAEVASTMQSVTGAMSDMFEAVAGDSEAYEKFKKAMAIVDAMISMAQTIASATAASTAGDPYTMAIRIASNVAAVTAQFAAVIKSIKAAAIPSAGSFSTGGIVPGSSYVGDRLRAAVNSREMILTLSQQRRLFDLIKAGSPVAGQGYEVMVSAFREALADMPAPRLVYREFKDFERRILINEKKMK